MSYKEITQGQKDWLSTLNVNFKDLNTSFEESDAITYLNGATPKGGSSFNNIQQYLFGDKEYRLVMVRMHFTITLSPNQTVDILKIPEGFTAQAGGYPVGGDIGLEVDGHAGGYLHCFLTAMNQVTANYVPANQDTASHQFKVAGTIAWKD